MSAVRLRKENISVLGNKSLRRSYVMKIILSSNTVKLNKETCSALKYATQNVPFVTEQKQNIRLEL